MLISSKTQMPKSLVVSRDSLMLISYPNYVLHNIITPLKVGYGICETAADFENKQFKWSYPLSFNADSYSTHSKYMDAQSCTSEHRFARASH